MSEHDTGGLAADKTRAAELLAGGMQCNCDLDNWEPERSTGHSWVCRIHKVVISERRRESSDAK